MPRRRTYAARLTVRVTEAERRRISDRARGVGLSASRYLVEAGLAATDPLDPAERAALEAALFHLRKVGVSLNQIARRLNAGGQVPQDALDRALAAADEALQRFTGRT
jgi:hypothetical protein